MTCATGPLDLFQDVSGFGGPDKGFGVLVVIIDVALNRHGQTTQPGWRADLNYRVFATEQCKSVSLPAKGKVHRKMD